MQHLLSALSRDRRLAALPGRKTPWQYRMHPQLACSGACFSGSVAAARVGRLDRGQLLELQPRWAVSNAPLRVGIWGF
jgi:hypothetical protein